MKSRIILAAALWMVATAHAQPGATDADTVQVDPGEGPEASGMMPINLDQVMEVAVRVSPNVARARVDRSVAGHQAAGERRGQAWTMTANTGYSQQGISDHVEAPPYQIVEQDTLSASLGLGRALPTGGSIQFEVGAQHQHTEYSLLDTLLTQTASSSTGAGTRSNMPTDEA